MGWNTTLVLMNDALSEIKKDQEIGEAIYKAVQELGIREGIKDIRAGNHINGITVIEQHHADSLMVVAVGGNCGQVLGYGGGYASTPEQILDTLAHSMGYRLVRLPTNKRIKP